jgi:cobalt-zinc-cadmium efflux system membrane fusion protein
MPRLPLMFLEIPMRTAASIPRAPGQPLQRLAAMLVLLMALRPPTFAPAADEASPPVTASPIETIDFPQASWAAAGIVIAPAAVAPLGETVSLTGKVTLNEDRVAHIYPLVEGRVDEVRVTLGQQVQRGEVLVILQSREVGDARLKLVQDRLQRDFAATKQAWHQSVAANTEALINMLRANAAVEKIEAELHNRPLGAYREKLISAYVAHVTARKNLDRLTPLSQEGLVSGRQRLQAEADYATARATLQSLLEQIDQEAQLAATAAAQTLAEIETRVVVDETALKIIGLEGEAITAIDPKAQGEAIAHCPIQAPFDGTVLSKDVVLMEHVGPSNQILSVADLSTVWVVADVYEEQLPLLERLDRQTLKLSCDAWPGETFEAKIFSKGSVVHEISRTVAVRALAENADGRLKPGMFVRVQLPGVEATAVLQVPLAAVLEHEGKAFVFAYRGGSSFQRRDVVMGRRSGSTVEIRGGIEPGERIVTGGGFALKSRMLSSLLEE